MKFSFLTFLTCGLLGWISALMHGIYVHRLGNYLKENHPDTWKDLVPKSVLGISTKYIGGRNYFKEIVFYFSKDDLSDDIIISHKKKVKFYLLVAVIFWISAFCALSLGP